MNAKTATSITCNVSPSTLTLGDGVTVSGEISPEIVGVEVILTCTKPDGKTFTRKTVTSMASSYIDFYRPDAIGSWSVVASWAGNDQYEGATSSPQSFTVVGLPAGTSKITCMTDSSSILLGGQVKIYGAITPAISASVTVEVSANGISWSTLTIVTSGSDGSYSYTWTPSRVGSYSIRSSWPGDGGRNGATSNEVRVFVHGAEEPDFSISADPSSRTVDPGQTTTFTVTLASLYGFNQEVSLSVSNLPTYTTGSFNPASLSNNASSTLTVSTSSSTPPGTYALTIAGSGPGKTRAVDVTLDIRALAVPSRCFIATATFGSELSPEVRFLREFRDQEVMYTLAGREFMTAFNAWYYSFSPTMAKTIADYPLIQTIARILLYPLVGILHLSAATYSVLSFNPELAVVAAGLLASSFIGAVYFSPFVILGGWLLQLKRRVALSPGLFEALAGLWLAGLALIVVGEALCMAIALMLGACIFVLASLSLSAIGVGDAVLRALRKQSNETPDV